MRPILKLLIAARPYRRLVWLTLIVAAVSIVLLCTLPTLSPTQEQRNIANFGQAKAIVSPLAGQRLAPGDPVPELPVAVQRMFPAAESVSELRATIGVLDESQRRHKLAYHEMATPSFGSEGKWVLSSGHWPEKSAEVVVSAASDIPISQTLWAGAGQLELLVVGIIEIPAAENTVLMVAHPGTWQSWHTKPDQLAPKTPAVVDYYFSSLPTNPDQQDTQDFFIMRRPTDHASSSLTPLKFWSQVFPLMLLPVALVFVLTGSLARWFTRIKNTCFRIGIKPAKLLQAVLVATVAGVATALAFGQIVGIGVSYAIRPLLERINDRQLAPIEIELKYIFLIIGLCLTVAIAGIGLGLMQRKQGAQQHQLNVSALRMLTTVGIIFCAVGVVIQAQELLGDPRYESFAAAILYALGLSCLIPVILNKVLVRKQGKLMPGDLAGRIIRNDLRRHGLILGAMMLVLSISCSVFAVTVTFDAMFNRSDKSFPRDVITVQERDGDGQKISPEFLAEFEKDLAVTKPFMVHKYGCIIGDGMIINVANVAEAEILLGQQLSSESKTAFAAGKLLTDSITMPSSVKVARDCQSTPEQTVAVHVIPHLEGIGVAGGGVRKDPGRNDKNDRDMDIYVYHGASQEQQVLARQWTSFKGQPQELVRAWRQVDKHGSPVAFIVALVALVSIVVIIMIQAFTSEIRRLRPLWSSIYSLGIKRRFLVRTIFGMGLVYLLTIVFGMLAVMLLNNGVIWLCHPRDYDMSGFPWQEILWVTIFFGLAVLLGTVTSIRGLSAKERIRGSI